jgi:hypothetical protein
MKSFLELIKENPKLPIVCMVDGEVCCGEDHSRWCADFGSARVAEFIFWENHPYGSGTFLDKEDVQEVREYLEMQDLSDAKVDEIIAGIQWKKAIVVNVDLPESIEAVTL